MTEDKWKDFFNALTPQERVRILEDLTKVSSKAAEEALVLCPSEQIFGLLHFIEQWETKPGLLVELLNDALESRR